METKHVIILASVGVLLIITVLAVGLYLGLKKGPECPKQGSGNDKDDGIDDDDNENGASSDGDNANGRKHRSDSKFHEYQEVSLKLHNKLRKRHDAQALKMSGELNDIAKKCSKHYAKIGVIDHSCPDKKLKDGSPVGENLYFAFHSNPKDKTVGDDDVVAKMGTQWWYDEVKMYDFSQPVPKNFHLVGHFTALVWRDTKELGIHISRSPNKDKVFLVGIYYPPGNFNNAYKENVHPLEYPD